MKKLKKYMFLLACLLLIGAVWASVTVNYTEDSSAGGGNIFRKATITYEATDLDSTVTQAVEPIYGFIFRISIVTTGNDADFDVLLRDENDITIFTKTGLNAGSSEDFSYAVYEDDTEGNPWIGVSVGGAMDVVITDGAALTGLDVNIYYIKFWR